MIENTLLCNVFKYNLTEGKVKREKGQNVYLSLVEASDGLSLYKHRTNFHTQQTPTIIPDSTPEIKSFLCLAKRT